MAKSTEYLFDGLFGPLATQECVYEKAVSPILNQVMQGYNCTIFAYGQTGTGKTFTMEGDLGLTSGGASVVGTPMVSRIPGQVSDALSSARLSTQAGMIPRTLHNMFYLLRKQSVDSYVRVSYVEIYKEELRDLLSGASTKDDSTHARMGYEAGSGNLKVLDSGTDKGVVIQGLEERIVTNAREAISLLHAGATRRKVAATQCNDKSSRSHAIFTITVFIREHAATVEGEDVVKLGKLNLVDLAGSESIGRSGAQNDNAHEAGKINQSLLVLGRVITALGAKANAKDTRVPYRDSKLTHILKDSLGGRTRTCMIATISNSTDNIEVTTSTLQYASQARGIRNRPVANRKVSRSEIVHDMQLQMEQLRRDLDAARDGEGFFMTRGSYEELVAQSKSAKEVAEEWKLDAAQREEEALLVTMRLAETTKALEATQLQLQHREDELKSAQDELEQTRVSLQQQAFLTKAHMFHEDSLNSAAYTLRGSLSASVADIHGLHDKIARMSDRERLNLAAVEDISGLVGRETSRVLAAVNEHSSRADAQARQLVDGLRERVGEQFESAVRDHMQRHVDCIGTQIASVASSASRTQSAAHGKHTQGADAVDALVGELLNSVSELASQGVAECTAFVDSVQKLVAQQGSGLADAATGIQQLVDSSVRDITVRLEQTQSQARDLVDTLSTEADQLREAHRQQVLLLRSRIRELQDEAQADDAKLVDTVANMLAQRRSRAEQTLGDVVAAADSHCEASATHTARLVDQSRVVETEVGESSASLLATLHTTQAGVGERLGAAQAAHGEAAAAHTELVEAHATHLGQQLNAVGPEAVGRAQADVTGAVGLARRAVDEACQGAEAAAAQLQQLAATGIRGAQEASDAAVHSWRMARLEMEELASVQAGERETAAAGLERGIEQLPKSVDGAAAGVQPTLSGGMTPKRRGYRSIEQWNVTRAHDDILQQLVADAGRAGGDDMGWTGMPADDDAHMAVSDDAEVHMVTDSSGRSSSSNSNGTLAPSPVERPESNLLRKRPSESAESPSTDHAGQRPTRRARNTLSEAQNEEDGEPVSAIAAPQPPSRLPAPRRTRRTRG